MDVTQVFDCKMCGICCEGKGGIVVSPTDLERLASYLKLEPEQVVATYAEYVGTKLKLRHENGVCVFFVKERGCTVHEGKPAICKAWPFFRGNLVDPESFALAKDFCPGISANVTFEDFVRFGFAYLQNENLIAHNAATEANALIV